MKKGLKWLLIAILGLVLLFAIAIAIFVATFNPNTYKSNLEEYVMENYSRVLAIKGDIGLSVFPDLALEIKDASLSEPDSTDQFAAIGDARLSVAVWPLLSKQVEINHISISDLDANIVKNTDGKFNFDDLLATDTTTDEDDTGDTESGDEVSGISIAVAGIDINNSQLNYHDKKSGLKLSVYQIEAKTGAINLGQAFDAKFGALVNSNKPQMALRLQLASEITLSDNYQDILLNKLAIQTSGDLDDLKQLKTDLQANAHLQNGNIKVNNLQLNLMGDLAGEKPLPGIDLQLANGQLNLYPKGSDLTGDLAIDRASYKDQIRDVQISDIGAKVNSGSNGLVVDDIVANLYEGKLAAKFSSNKNKQIGLNLDLQQISLQALLKSLSSKDLLAGRGFIQLDIRANGNDLQAIENSLSGSLAMQVQEGAVLGVNARQALEDVSALIDGLSNIKQLRLDQISSPFKKNGETKFSAFDLAMGIKNGQANVNKLVIKSELITVTHGSPAIINIPAQNIDLVLNAKVVDDLAKSEKLKNVLGLTIPVHISGAWSDPKYSVKLDSLLRDQTIKSVIESGLGKLLGTDKKSGTKDSKSSPEQAVGKALKGLFGG